MKKEEIIKSKVGLELEPKESCGVYFLIDNNEVVYVGSSTDIYSRIKVHRTRYKKQFDSYYFIKCIKSEMLALENDYVLKLAPKYNKLLPLHKEYTSIKKFKEIQKNRPATLNAVILNNRLYVKKSELYPGGINE